MREKMKEVVFVYEAEEQRDELCILGPGNMAEQIDFVGDPAEWDTLILNETNGVVSMSGPRFTCEESVVGKPLKHVISGNLYQVVQNLVDVTFKGKGNVHSLNVMYGRKPLTMQAFAITNSKKSVGTVVIVRPTKYDDKDLIQFLGSDKDIPASSNMPSTASV